MSGLRQRVERHILDQGLLTPGQAVLAAVSGGLDSMVLMHLLARLAKTHGWKLTVAHFNHRLRGRDSAADERLVKTAAQALHLPFVRNEAAVKAFARREKLSVEMAARRLRHEFLAAAAQDRKISTLALAHHADDQLELFFLRLLRGAGPDGLAGMKWSSPSPADAALRLIRPLLDCSKAELGHYAAEERIRYREDATNHATDILRNRIRHELLPLLRRDYQPGLGRTLLRVMNLLEAEADYLREAALAWLKAKSRIPFLKCHSALQRRIVQQQLQRLGVAFGYDLVEKLRLGEAPVSVSPELTVSRDAAGMVHSCPIPSASFQTGELELSLTPSPGQAVFGTVRFSWAVAVVSGDKWSTSKPASGVEYFDAEQVGNQVILRHWRPGDRFQPSGMSRSVKLQDLFCNLKVPKALRHQLIVATTAAGELFWVEGLRIAEPCKLRPQTRRRLRWEWERRPAG